MSIEQVAQEALKLSQQERAVLIERLLSSLSAEEAHDLLWAEEAERRYKEFKQDKSKGIAAETVFEKMRRKFK